jgi:hypothetical protein
VAWRHLRLARRAANTALGLGFIMLLRLKSLQGKKPPDRASSCVRSVWARGKKWQQVANERNAHVLLTSGHLRTLVAMHQR